MENWKNIPGFEHYEASDAGRIRSTSFEIIRSNGRHYTHNGRVISQREDKDGYLIVQFYCGDKRTVQRVHRLVYTAFYGQIEDGLVVDHINHNRRDNRVENLQLLTNTQNIRKRLHCDKLPIGVYRQRGRIKYRAIIQIEGKGYYLGSFLSVDEANRVYNEALKNYENDGLLPVNPIRVRHAANNGMKICSCCGRNLSVSDYYISRGRIQGKCKECFKNERKQIYKNLKT